MNYFIILFIHFFHYIVIIVKKFYRINLINQIIEYYLMIATKANFEFFVLFQFYYTKRNYYVMDLEQV